VIGETMFFGGSGNDARPRIATARDWKRQIRLQGFVITVSWPYSRANGGEPKTSSQRVSTRDRIGALLSTTKAASRSRLGSRHGMSSGYTRYGDSNISLETANVSPLSNSNG